MIKCYAFLSMCMGLSYEHLTIFLIALGSLPLDGPAWIWPAPSLRRSCQSTTCTRKTSSSRWRTCSSSTRPAPAPQGTLCSITLLGDTSKDLLRFIHSHISAPFVWPHQLWDFFATLLWNRLEGFQWIRICYLFFIIFYLNLTNCHFCFFLIVGWERLMEISWSTMCCWLWNLSTTNLLSWW